MQTDLFSIQTLWFEISMVTLLILLGHIFLGHFEERSPKWRKFVKYLLTVGVVLATSIYISRSAAFILLGLSLIPVLYIHIVLLPRKGINGWTGEPKARYYDFRGWNKNIFDDKTAK